MSCPICYNNITDINKVVTECNHVFHFTCIYKNLKTNISTGEQCPLCRKSFNTPSFSLCPPGATIGEQQIRIIQNLFRTPQIPRPQNTLIRMMAERRRNRPVPTHTEPHRVRRREIKRQIAKLSFDHLKNKLREKGVSSRGYLRDTLEKRLFDKMIAE
ncbi:MAG: hypothetical protein CXT73_06210 [Methanobacteriota archaeon]|jgi:hypothetical protein|nr:MAG: hypothetical protein CXT73_06210 [Euryarchaeota archaeon]